MFFCLRLNTCWPGGRGSDLSHPFIAPRVSVRSFFLLEKIRLLDEWFTTGTSGKDVPSGTPANRGVWRISCIFFLPDRTVTHRRGGGFMETILPWGVSPVPFIGQRVSARSPRGSQRLHECGVRQPVCHRDTFICRVVKTFKHLQLLFSCLMKYVVQNRKIENECVSVRLRTWT